MQNNKDGTLVRKPEFDDAIIHYKKAISINKNYAKAHYNLALVYKIKKHYDESRKHFERAINIVNDYAKAHFHLAMLFKTAGKVFINKAIKPSISAKKKTAGRNKN